MVIRILTRPDAAAFQSLRLEGLRESPAAFSSSHEEESNRPIDFVAARLAESPLGAVFGVFDGDRLVGVTGVRREEHAKLAHKAYLWGVYITPAYRRRGLGRGLLSAALEHAFGRLDVRQVNLGVGDTNRAAIGLYESLGFQTFGLERAFLCVDGVLYDERHMVCTRESFVVDSA